MDEDEDEDGDGDDIGPGGYPRAWDSAYDDDTWYGDEVGGDEAEY